MPAADPSVPTGPTDPAEPVAGPVIGVVGPTASGKSALALALAGALGGEIVNADALQLYRGMDIGTAKTPPGERRGVPHHLIDVLDVTQEASVAWYQEEAERHLTAVAAAGAVPLLVGGSGLYLRSVLDELDFPDTDPQVRARWERRGEVEGPGILHRELAERDPIAAERIGSRNTRRLVRALEVIELTGRPFSASLPQYRYRRPAIQLALRVERPVLVERIARRARMMFSSGLMAETASLRELGLERGITASRAVGYAQALGALDGRWDVEQAIELTAIATRQVARRQMSWFGRDPRIVWLDGDQELARQVGAALAALERAGIVPA